MIGAAIPIVTGEQRPTAADVLGDVAQAQMVEIRDHRGQTVLSGEFRSQVEVDIIGLPARATFTVPVGR